MARTLAGVLTGLMVLAAVGVANAGIPDPDLSFATVGPDPGMTTCPSGDGEAYQYLTVTAKRSDTSAIQGIPSTSFFFSTSGGSCSFDAVQTETDVNGEIQFEVVGDETIIGDLLVYCQIYTVALNDADTISCISYDITDDDLVGLQDYTLFSGDYGNVAPRSDFNWSGGVVGLQDYTLFSAHYGH